jgi:hypothetical protein
MDLILKVGRGEFGFLGESNEPFRLGDGPAERFLADNTLEFRTGFGGIDNLLDKFDARKVRRKHRYSIAVLAKFRHIRIHPAIAEPVCRCGFGQLFGALERIDTREVGGTHLFQRYSVEVSNKTGPDETQFKCFHSNFAPSFIEIEFTCSNASVKLLFAPEVIKKIPSFIYFSSLRASCQAHYTGSGESAADNFSPDNGMAESGPDMSGKLWKKVLT